MTAQTLIIVLLATILIELTVLWYLGERSRKVLAASVVINILTNPLFGTVGSYVAPHRLSSIACSAMPSVSYLDCFLNLDFFIYTLK